MLWYLSNYFKPMSNVLIYVSMRPKINGSHSLVVVCTYVSWLTACVANRTTDTSAQVSGPMSHRERHRFSSLHVIWLADTHGGVRERLLVLVTLGREQGSEISERGRNLKWSGLVWELDCHFITVTSLLLYPLSTMAE